jgi:two-component sensor histidine kinase
VTDRVLKAGSVSLDERLVRPDGTIVWIHNSAFVMPDEDGVVRRIGGIAEDVTERRAAEERLKLLAAEVDHRAKNLLAVVQVMLRQTRGTTVPEYAKAAQGRIAALARAHTLLSRSHWRGADLRRLVMDELAAFQRGDGERIVIDGTSVLLRPEAAQSIALALHELATNATKYGGLSVPQGRIAVVWRRDSNGDLSLRWSETGGPPVSPPSRKGTGANVIERSIGQQLSGAVRFDWQRTGMVCEIHVPARQFVGETRD